jgi:hypothetical protein
MARMIPTQVMMYPIAKGDLAYNKFFGWVSLDHEETSFNSKQLAFFFLTESTGNRSYCKLKASKRSFG